MYITVAKWASLYWACAVQGFVLGTCRLNETRLLEFTPKIMGGVITGSLKCEFAISFYVSQGWMTTVDFSYEFGLFTRLSSTVSREYRS